VTNIAANFRDCLDYIFTLDSIHTNKILAMPDKTNLGRAFIKGLPREGLLPSDHIALMVEIGID